MMASPARMDQSGGKMPSCTHFPSLQQQQGRQTASFISQSILNMDQQFILVDSLTVATESKADFFLKFSFGKTIFKSRSFRGPVGRFEYLLLPFDSPLLDCQLAQVTRPYPTILGEGQFQLSVKSFLLKNEGEREVAKVSYDSVKVFRLVAQLKDGKAQVSEEGVIKMYSPGQLIQYLGGRVRKQDQQSIAIMGSRRQIGRLQLLRQYYFSQQLNVSASIPSSKSIKAVKARLEPNTQLDKRQTLKVEVAEKETEKEAQRQIQFDPRSSVMLEDLLEDSKPNKVTSIQKLQEVLKQLNSSPDLKRRKSNAVALQDEAAAKYYAVKQCLRKGKVQASEALIKQYIDKTYGRRSQGSIESLVSELKYKRYPHS